MKPMADTVKSDEFTYQIRCTAAVFLFQPKTDHDSICIFARSRRVPEDYGIRTIPGIRLEYCATLLRNRAGNFVLTQGLFYK